jgi:hypothetical protein
MRSPNAFKCAPSSAAHNPPTSGIGRSPNFSSGANRDLLPSGKKVWAGGEATCIEIGYEMCSELTERWLNRASCQMEFAA